MRGMRGMRFYALGFVGAYGFLAKAEAKELRISDLKIIVQKMEKHHKLPRGLLDSIIQQESSYRVKALNPATRKGTAIPSYGLGQLTKDTAEWHCKLDMSYIYRPRENLRCTAKVLQYQLRRYSQDLDTAVAAYNWGTPCVCNGEVYKQTLAKRTRTCRNKKGQPLKCAKKGLFWNQKYVDDVLGRMGLRSDGPMFTSLDPSFRIPGEEFPKKSWWF